MSSKNTQSDTLLNLGHDLWQLYTIFYHTLKRQMHPNVDSHIIATPWNQEYHPRFRPKKARGKRGKVRRRSIQASHKSCVFTMIYPRKDLAQPPFPQGLYSQGITKSKHHTSHITSYKSPISRFPIIPSCKRIAHRQRNQINIYVLSSGESSP